MAAKLLIIDPQNDFCEFSRSALPVTGANADMQRLVKFMRGARGHLNDVVVTLDSHPTVAIERTTFWMNADHEAVEAFTVITEDDVRAGKYLPRNRNLLPQVLTYLHELELRGRYKLMVWPVHCVLGTWGHAIHEDVAYQLAAWEERWVRGAVKILKGLNPLTEQYSALRAEVPLSDDPSTQTNETLLVHAFPDADHVFIAGEAASHCVKATMEHLYDMVPDQSWLSRYVLLKDCMSPVTGFQAQAEQFFADSQARGVRVMTSDEALALLK